MRLTKTDKEAFVRAVMDDVPLIDYVQQANDAFEAWFITQLPPKVRAVYEDKELRSALDNSWMHGGLPDIVSNYWRAGRFVDAHKLPLDLKDKLHELKRLSNEQAEKRAALKAQIKATINSCSTLKAAKERLPEFEKYLPADRDGTGVGNLPVVANLVANLTSAGWPKGAVQGA